MSNYTKTTDFEAKDSLPSGDSGKIIRGSEFETEFDNIATAIATKADAANPTFTGTVTIDGLTVNGNTTLGNAATDTVTVTADIASNLIPSADDTYNLGASGAEWNDLYVDGTAYVDAINFNGTAITATAAELNIMDGVTATTAELNIMDGVTATTAELNYVDGVTSAIQTQLDSKANLSGANFTGSIDVTGTVTSDGLTVQGESYFDTNNGSRALHITRYGTVESESANFTIDDNDLIVDSVQDEQYGGYVFKATRNGVGTVNRLAIENNGDISFYEDTGTTAKFFWDASAENLQLSLNGEALKLGSSSGTDDAYVSFQGSRALVGLDDSLGTITGTASSAFIKSGGGRGIAFNVNGASSSAVVLDTSGNVGIGTVSPSGLLHISAGASGATPNTNANDLIIESGTNAGISILGDGNEVHYLMFGDAANSTVGRVLYDHNSDHLALWTNGSEAMRIDSSGNVGIGGSTPSEKLEVSNGSAIDAGEISIKLGGDVDNSARTMTITKDTSSPYNTIINTQNNTAVTTGSLVFKNGSTEQMRIDSSGNLLVGKTSAGLSTVGVEARATGVLGATADGVQAAYFTRKTSDGTIAEFRKDGTTVGSIGASTGYLYIGDGDTNLAFSAGSDLIFPRGSGGVARDAAIDLGNSSNRFKNLYLSEGAYLGGTSAANKLDDYEEGTWTPTLTFGGADTGNVYGSQTGRYTKIGNVVHVDVYVRLTTLGSATGNAEISGLPFTVNSGNESGGSVGYFINLTGLTSTPIVRPAPSGTTLELRDTTASDAVRITHGNFTATSDIRLSATYKV